MNRIIFLIGIAFFACIFLLLHVYALDLYLYGRLWWFDILMHGLGGALIGMIALWFFIFEFKISPRYLLLFSLGGVVCIGISWEIFETVFVWEVHQSLPEYAFDTLIDICMDVIGAFVAYIALRHVYE